MLGQSGLREARTSSRLHQTIAGAGAPSGSKLRLPGRIGPAPASPPESAPGLTTQQTMGRSLRLHPSIY
jgi:hypothetical protein